MNTLLVVLISGSLLFYLACTFCTINFFTAKEEVNNEKKTPISIMISVCGLDPDAWLNWLSFCQQNYPDYEILFGVTNPEDPAIPLLKKLMATAPNRVQVYTDLPPKGSNHKDSNLSYLLAKAQHETIIFADSDIRVNSEYINTVTAPLKNESVGMVTNVFVGRNPQSLGAAIASFGRCFDFIPSLLISRFLDGGLRCAVGVTIATRKSTLADFGGLHLNRIGSDYNLGKRAALAGYRVELSREVLESDTGKETVWEVFRRELRWARTIRFNRGAIYYTMIFCYGTVYCLPLLWLSEFANWAIALSLITFVLRYAQVIVAIFSMNCLKLLLWLWALPLRDLLSLVIWLTGAFGRSVYWRGRRLRIEGDGLISEWEK